MVCARHGLGGVMASLEHPGEARQDPSLVFCRGRWITPTHKSAVERFHRLLIAIQTRNAKKQDILDALDYLMCHIGPPEHDPCE